MTAKLETASTVGLPTSCPSWCPDGPALTSGEARVLARQLIHFADLIDLEGV